MIEILAILFSPVIAVGVTLWYQGRRERRERKERLFTTLMANRKAFPPTYEFVAALNLIDVVFSDSPQVVRLWHEYYDLLGSEGNYSARQHKYIELLSEMARKLGYKRLQQTDIDKYYSPQAHVDQSELQYQLQRELLRVLQGTGELRAEPREPSPPPAGG